MNRQTSITKPVLDKEQIESLIPHSGRMCLIDRIDGWNSNSIDCSAASHQASDNPLRLNGKLSSVILLEYGAQAMAIHGGLLKQASTPGFLAAVRNVKIHCEALDNIDGLIKIKAAAEIKTEEGVIYQFAVFDGGGKTLLTARATVINT